MTLSAIFYPYRFVHTILSVPFCPIPFCPYTILSVPFCPYHFVRYHFVLEPLNEVLSSLEERLQNPYHQARIKASQSSHASDWLYALPISARGLRLDDETLRVADGLRLGMAICEPHVCACGAQVSSRGAHGLSCSLGFGRQARHSNVNDIIHRSLNRAGIPAIKEPSGLTRSDGKRPDGQTLIPWSGDRTLLWDATVRDTWPPHTSRRQPLRPEGRRK